MKASFYLTPDLKEKLLKLSLRTEDGQLHVWNNQPGTGLIEQDPSKSMNFLIVETSRFIIRFLHSLASPWRCWAIRFPERLSQAFATHSSDPW
jgi:hypothetical protein